MTILVMFQMMRFRDFKTFYCGFLQIYWRSYFAYLPTYHRFVEIMQRATFPMTLFAQLKTGRRTDIYYVDSSGLPVCHLKRQKRHKTFQTIAQFGKSSVGWFFGLKLHIVINNKGELIAFKITKGNHSDIKAAEPLLKTLRGLAFGDKGYISKKLFETLLNRWLWRSDRYSSFRGFLAHIFEHSPFCCKFSRWGNYHGGWFYSLTR